MPNNNISWGQGAANNSIGWGAGATNNNRDWGYIHSRSYGHDETNLTGSRGGLYISTAQASGYSGGSSSCVDETFNALSAVE